MAEASGPALVVPPAAMEAPSMASTPSNQHGDGLLEGLALDREMQVDFSNLSCFVKKSFEKILHNITGAVHPGELLALMGPSGSGKTTLLSVLGGRTPAGVRQSGSILFNGGPLTKSTKRQVGYVLQDDLLYETLTVYEVLYFAAMLRLPSHMTKAEKLERVESVITALGLHRCRDTLIGGFFRRGISGGERKRVSVGHELLVNPSLLLLDEPTSGLDATTAMHLLQVLNQLARAGRAVVLTLHQPSSRLYQQLDHVLLLSQGRAVYYGAATACAEWVELCGHPVPFGVNLADWILDLSSGEVAAPSSEHGRGAGAAPLGSAEEAAGEAERQRLVAVSEMFLQRHPAGYRGGMQLEDKERAALAGDVSNLWVSSSASPSSDSADDAAAAAPANGGGVSGLISLLRRKLAPSAATPPDVQQDEETGTASNGQARLLRSRTSKAASKLGATRWGASYMMQLRVLFVRSVRVRRFETMAVQDLAQFLIVGGLAGLIWWQVGRTDTVQKAEDCVGLIFFECLFLGFRTLFVALFTFPQERKMMLKERASGMYRLSAFYLARTMSDVPMDFTMPSILVILIYAMGGLRTGLWFFANYAVCLLSTLVAQSFGLLVGATVMVPKSAQTVAAVAMLSWMLVAGFYVRNIPSWIAWIRWTSFLTFSLNLLVKVEWSGRTLYDCEGVVPLPGQKLSPAVDCPAVPDIQNALKLQADPNQPPWEVAVLVAMLMFFRVAVYFALRIKTNPGGPAPPGRG